MSITTIEMSKLSISKNPQSLSHLAVAWINLSCFERTTSCLFASTAKPVLRNLNGIVKFGTLNAVMGSSTFERRALLRCISGLECDNISDDSEFYVSKYLKTKFCFIDANRHHFYHQGLTVKESLWYASRLKNRWRPCKDEILLPFDQNFNVNKLLVDLSLSDVADRAVNCCAEDDQKRLVLAMELTAMKKPNVVCLDQPTAGLDRHGAERNMQCFAKLARKYSLAVVTSHDHVSCDVLYLFHQVYVLAKGGFCVYCGPPENIHQFLTQAGIDVKDYQMPVDVLLKIASDNHDRKACRCCDLKKCNSLIQTMMTLLDEEQKYIRSKCATNGLHCYGDLANNTPKFFNPVDFFILFGRVTKINFRHWHCLGFQMILLLLMSYGITFCFPTDVGTDPGCVTTIDLNGIELKSDRKDPLWQQNLNCHYFTITLLLFTYLSVTILTFPSDVLVFLNEHRNRWYSTGSYFLSKTAIDLILASFVTYLYCWIAYFRSHQPGFDFWWHGLVLSEVDSRYLFWTLTVMLGVFNSQGLAYFFAVLSIKNYKLSVILATASFLVLQFFSGYFLSANELTPTMQTISELSFVRHVYENALLVVFGLERCHRNQSKVLLLLQQYEDEDVWYHFYWLLGNFVFWRLLALLVLIWRANPKLFVCVKRPALSRYHDMEWKSKVLTTTGSEWNFEPHSVDGLSNQASEESEVSHF